MTSEGQNLTALKPADAFPMGQSWVYRPELPLFSRVRHWLDDYFRGSPPEPCSLPLAPAGTAFQRQVWELLLDIPWGEARSYGSLALEISAGMSAQAVGGAVGRNPIAIIIPCHRVLGTTGSLTGYAWGLEKKRWLLDHEGRLF